MKATHFVATVLFVSMLSPIGDAAEKTIIAAREKSGKECSTIHKISESPRPSTLPFLVCHVSLCQATFFDPGRYSPLTPVFLWVPL